MTTHTHRWKTVGEDTGGYVKWCSVCGAIMDSDKKVEHPTHDDKQVPNNYIGNPFLYSE